MYTSESNPLSQAQNRYLELVRQKAERMSEADLLQETQQLETELRELESEAHAALEEAAAMLRTITVEAPGTDAAQKAALALQVIDERYLHQRLKSTDNDRPVYNPRPAATPRSPVPTY